MIFLVMMTVFPIVASSGFNISECERFKSFFNVKKVKDLLDCKEKGMHF